jgi:hypothetical protein
MTSISFFFVRSSKKKEEESIFRDSSFGVLKSFLRNSELKTVIVGFQSSVLHEGVVGVFKTSVKK